MIDNNVTANIIPQRDKNSLPCKANNFDIINN